VLQVARQDDVAADPRRKRVGSKDGLKGNGSKNSDNQEKNSNPDKIVIKVPLWLWRAIVTGGTSSAVTVALHFLLTR
jgi:hypothetical protein